MHKKGLGKGLEALFALEGENAIDSAEVAVDQLLVREGQPRRDFDESGLNELANSIQEHGILQPLLVRPVGDGRYELVAGERRFRAAKRLGMKKVPVVIREMDNRSAWEVALVENVQREDLTPIEEALAYREMINIFGYTQEEVALRVGKSRSYIANTVRLLNLPAKIVEMVADGRLSAGHARAILALKDETEQLKAAHRIIESGLTVRESEGATMNKGNVKKVKDLHMVELEDRLQEKLGSKVRLNRKRRGGSIEIAFFSDEDLQRILDILGVSI